MIQFESVSGNLTKLYIMNKSFDGKLDLNRKRPKGHTSKAAREAFRDILQDPDMMVSIEDISGNIYKERRILNEDFLRRHDVELSPKIMKLELSEYYKEFGFKAVYMRFNKCTGRNQVILVRNDGSLTGMSYAKYVYTSYHKCKIEKGDEIDHIDDNKLNDDISNLQVLSKSENARKNKKRRQYVALICPVCGKEFILPKNVSDSIETEPCCSKSCAARKIHLYKTCLSSSGVERFLNRCTLTGKVDSSNLS